MLVIMLLRIVMMILTVGLTMTTYNANLSFVMVVGYNSMSQ